jgi:capsular exopolysaccharide synthesis family protein
MSDRFGTRKDSVSARPRSQPALPLSPAPPPPPVVRSGTPTGVGGEARGLNDYLDVIRRRSWIVIGALLAVTVSVVLISLYVLPKEYRGTATLRILSRSALSAETVNADDIQYLERLGNTYAKLATSRPLRQELQQRLQMSSKPGVSVSLPSNTELMQLSVTTGDPEQSAAAANLLSQLLIARLGGFDERALRASDAAFVARISQLEREIARLQQGIKALSALAGPLSATDEERLLSLKEDLRIKQASAVTQRTRYEAARLVRQQRANTLQVAVPAFPPQNPSSPRLKLNLALGIMFGLIAGLALAFLRENLSTRVRSKEEIESMSGLPVLGEIPATKFKGERQLFEPRSSTEEAFRRLRSTLLAMASERPLKTLMVTSGDVGEGKSTIVANLAHSIALTGLRVLVVDADLRKSVQHMHFRVGNTVGLADVLRGAARLDAAIQRTSDPSLSVLAAGRLVSDPAELLRVGMPTLIPELAEGFDFVLIDSPALLPVVDALTIATDVDGVILITGHAQTRRTALEAVVHDFETFHVRPVGVVVNRTDVARSYEYYG